MNEVPHADFPPGIASPARRALTAAGHRTLAELAGVPVADLRRLHGMGPRALRLIQDALRERGMSLGPGEIDQ